MKNRIVLGLALALATAGCQESQIPGGDSGTDAGIDATQQDDASTDDASTDDASTDDASIDDDGGPVVTGPTCTTQIAAGAQNALLCAIDGPVRHVRITGVAAPAVHASAQLFLGLTAPTGSQTPLTAGQFKLQLYGGGAGGQPAPQVDAYFGEEGVTVEGDHAFVNTPSTICFDIHDGAADERAAFVLWRDGVGGADCEDRATLTLANAYSVLHAPSNGAIIKDASAYFYQASSVTATPSIMLFDTLAVEDVPEPLPASCSTEIATTSAARYVELCPIEGAVQHVKIEGLVAAPMHTSAQLLIGLDTPPTPNVAPGALTADQWKLQVYGGGAAGPGMTIPPQIDAFFGEEDATIEGDASFVATASTICFDIHDGSATTPPYFILWRDGEDGADCDDLTTLTLANAFGMELAYGRTNGAIDKSAPLYFYQTTHTATPTVTISSTPAVTPEIAATGTTCTTEWTVNPYWQELCMPAAGRPRHVRIEDATSTITSKYFYLVLNEPAAPADPLSTTGPGAPAAGDGRFVFTGGWSNNATSWTWLRFNGGSTTQESYAVGADPLYSMPHDVCMDLGTQEDSENLRVLFWATGAGSADCADVSTLSVENALYDSAEAGDAFWDAPLGTTGLPFIKISGSAAGATLSRVVLSREPAVY